MGKGRGRRRRVEPTGEWEQIELLCGWLEQRYCELIRPLVLFGSPAAERARETGAASGRAEQRRLPPAVRRLIVDRARPSARPSIPPSILKR
jgi:hypothetical protein